MKLLTTSDIHQMGSKWKDLVKLCQQEEFDFVAIAGDIFPKDNGIQAQMDFVKHLKKYAKKIKDTGAELVFTLGNDDNQLLIPEMEEGDYEGLWYYLENSAVKLGGIEFAGMPYVPDYPFGYKYWCAGESKDNLRIDTIQFGDALLIDESNKFYAIEDYKAYLEKKDKIDEMLEDVLSQVSNFSKCIWLIHAPPAHLSLDVCANGMRVGSEAVLEFIKKQQPWITIHGHIHESPEFNGHKWSQHCDNTLCIQGGQEGFALNYVVLEIEDGKLVSKKHSKYER